MINPFEILGVSENSTEEEIKKRFRELLFQYHPDLTNESNTEKTKNIIEAFRLALTKVKKYDDKILTNKKRILKIDLFVEPKTEYDIYKIVYELLSKIEKYYYSDIETLENILNFLNNIMNNSIEKSRNLDAILKSLSLFFFARLENIKSKKIYSSIFENYKLVFFNYIKNIFNSKDYINYRMAINVNYNMLLVRCIELLKDEKESAFIDEITGNLMIIILFQEEEIYDSLFKILKEGHLTSE
ncbi:MAG TPA: DnaJ domain-containing protein [Spirochaetota bacterium]|nr:DnaJ domain-containing protein [Spirochaetota bacterium]